MNAARVIVRTLTRTVPRQAEKKDFIDPGYFKIKEKYQFFQKDDGLLVHQKGGFMDNVYLTVTCLIIAAGMVVSFDFMYRVAFNKMKK